VALQDFVHAGPSDHTLTISSRDSHFCQIRTTWWANHCSRRPLPAVPCPPGPHPGCPTRRTGARVWLCLDHSAEWSGKSNRTVVPFPGVVLISILPLHDRAKRCTIHKPSPLPRPGSLVVKNGSVAR
jgi:hypothetical protein